MQKLGLQVRHYTDITYIATPRSVSQTVKKGRWQQLQFKGDPMHRPVTSREFGFLVRWLVWLSVRLNRRLGLDQPVREDEMSESLWQVSMACLLVHMTLM